MWQSCGAAPQVPLPLPPPRSYALLPSTALLRGALGNVLQMSWILVKQYFYLMGYFLDNTLYMCLRKFNYRLLFTAS